MKTQLACPCTIIIRGEDEDNLVAKVVEHLATSHPGREYSRDEILLMAY